MNHPIKFRIWDIRLEFFLPLNESDTFNLYYFLNRPKEYIVQQFTGLLDSKGKKMYEGDIVKDLDGENGEVRFDWGSFIIKINKIIMPFYSVLETQGYVQPRLINPECYEIIGNIFENSELISNKSDLLK